MQPGHDSYKAQQSSPPFNVTTDVAQVRGGETVDGNKQQLLKSYKLFTDHLKFLECIMNFMTFLFTNTVTIYAKNGEKFKGFYVQARDEKGTPIGTFNENTNAKTHSCSGIKSVR